jgi:hypothetical protein
MSEPSETCSNNTTTRTGSTQIEQSMPSSSETNSNNTTARAARSNDRREARRNRSDASSETLRMMSRVSRQESDGGARIQQDGNEVMLTPSAPEERHLATDVHHQAGDDMVGDTSITTVSRQVSSDSPNNDFRARLPVNCSSNEKRRSTSPERNASTTSDIQPGAYIAGGRAFGAPVRNIVARYSSRFLMRDESSTKRQDNSIVNANVVDEEDLEAEYRDRILGGIVEASEVQAVQESQEPPTFWERHKIPIILCIVMHAVLVLVITLIIFKDDDDDDDDDRPFRNMPTPTEAPSSADTHVQGYPALPPTLQGIHERGYIRCQVGDHQLDLERGHAIDLVSTL